KEKRNGSTQPQLAVRCSAWLDESETPQSVSGTLNSRWNYCRRRTSLEFRILRNKCCIFLLKCGQVIRFLRIRLYLFAYGCDVPLDFRWKRLFHHKLLNQVKSFD